MTNDAFEAARTGNWFSENPLAICRLDKLSRNEDVQAKLAQTDWDLVVCDESHKLSATYFGNEVKYPALASPATDFEETRRRGSDGWGDSTESVQGAQTRSEGQTGQTLFLKAEKASAPVQAG
jgi:hypothetical protein